MVLQTAILHIEEKMDSNEREQLTQYFTHVWPKTQKMLDIARQQQPKEDYEWRINWTRPERLATQIDKDARVLDVGCGEQPMKQYLNNVYGIDITDIGADEVVAIEDFKSDERFDVALCLGSINFGSEDLISKQVENLVLHMKEKSSIFWRLNPGNADHFGKLKDVYVRSPKLYETDSLRQLGKDLNESKKKLRKQGLLAMPNFYPWTVAKSFEFANKYNYNVTEVMPDGARLYVKWER